MGKSVSTDLRLRIVGAIASGKSCRAAAAQFEVAPSTAIRVKARYEATGSVAPAKQGRPKGSGKLGACRQAIIDKVKVQPDITMPALALLLEAEHGVSADPSNLSKLLCQEGFTYKKNAVGIGERTFRHHGTATGMGHKPPALHAPPA